MEEITVVFLLKVLFAFFGTDYASQDGLVGLVADWNETLQYSYQANRMDRRIGSSLWWFMRPWF